MKIAENELDEQKGAKSIKAGSVFGYIAFFLNILYGLFFVPWVSSCLGEEYGVYSICFSLISLFLIDFGLGATTNVFISKYRANHSEKDVNKFVSTTFKIFLLLDVVIALIFTAVYFLIPVFYSDPIEWPLEKLNLLRNIFLIVAIYSVLSFPFSILQGILLAYEKFAENKIIDISSKILHIILTSCILIFNSSQSSTIYLLLISYALSGIVGVLLRLFVVKKKIGLRFGLLTKFDFGYAKTIFSYSIFTAIIGICSRLIFTICPVIIGATAGSTASGTFNFISIIEGYIFTFGSILSDFFVAKISREQTKENSIDRINTLAIKVGRLQLFFIGLVILGFGCCGQEFCEIWLKNNPLYSPSEVYYGVLIICLYQIGYVPETIFYSSTLTSKRGVKFLSILYAARAAVNVCLVCLFSHFWGALGACVAIFIVRTIGFVSENVLYRKLLKVDLKEFFFKVFLPYLGPFLITLICGLGMHFALQFSSLDTIIRFFLVGFITVLSYLISVFLFLVKIEVRREKIASTFKWLKSDHESKVPTIEKLSSRKSLFFGILIGCFSLLLIVGVLSPFVFTNIGISGCYVFEYDGQVLEELTLNAANKAKYVKFDYSDGQKKIKFEQEYRWNLDFSKSNSEQEPNLVVSKYQLKICDNNWGSYWQYYYLDGKFYSKEIYAEYGNKQIVFAKKVDYDSHS